MWATIVKAWNILMARLHEQGLWVTLQWAWGRGISKLTGVPMLAYSRITPQVYVGPQYNQRGKKLLESEGVNADVNLRIEFDDAAHGLALEQYCHLPTIDDDGPSPEHFQKGVDFIDGVVRNGGKVYIHCKAGVGRAPTMAAAYFISTGMTASEALALIKETRPFITPTPPQVAALSRYESYVRNNGRKTNNQ